jgi:hypothetical protein
MMTCIPESLFTWDFQVEGAAVEPAALTFDFFTEQGGIRYGNTEYTVKKHGWLSGEWTLENNGEPCASAQKTNPLTRRFEIEEQGRQFLLTGVILTRSYEISQNDSVIGSIAPAHFMTRRATIDCSPEMSEPAQLFCFWLAALTWRRDERSSNSGS